jgi:hypothetical protein
MRTLMMVGAALAVLLAGSGTAFAQAGPGEPGGAGGGGGGGGGAAAGGGGGGGDTDEVPSGIELGLRTGYAIPLGNYAGGGAGNVSDIVSGAIPIWIDAGYRIASPNLFIGAYFQYAIGLVANNAAQTVAGGGQCGQGGLSCSANVLKYGIQAHYHIAPAANFDPWVGLGIGMESLNASASLNGTSGNGTLSGWDYLIFQAGGDFHVASSFGIGPMLMFSLGQYNNLSTGGAAGNTSASIQNTAMHEWLTFGVRGVFDIPVGGGN